MHMQACLYLCIHTTNEEDQKTHRREYQMSCRSPLVHKLGHQVGSCMYGLGCQAGNCLLVVLPPDSMPHCVEMSDRRQRQLCIQDTEDEESTSITSI